LIEFVGEGIVVVSVECSIASSQLKIAFYFFALDSMDRFGNKLIFGLSLICLIAHSDNNIAVSSIFINWFSLGYFFLIEILSITALVVIITVKFQLYIGRLGSFAFIDY